MSVVFIPGELVAFAMLAAIAAASSSWVGLRGLLIRA
jgi:hypothetical protein